MNGAILASPGTPKRMNRSSAPGLTHDHAKDNVMDSNYWRTSLKRMCDEINQADILYQPSNIWSTLTSQHINEIENDGLGEFKRKVNNYYGQWKDDAVTQYHLPNLKHATGIDKPEFPIDSLNDCSKDYADYIAILWDMCHSIGDKAELAKLQEPMSGNPYYINYRGTNVSQDLAKSYIEYTCIKKFHPSFTESSIIAELGAGYGRLASVFAVLTNARYFIFDIPPALLVAQEYFKAIFGPDNVTPFTEYRSLDEVAANIGPRRFAFFTPNQIELFDRCAFDLFINVDSMGEMSTQSAAHYAEMFGARIHPGGTVYYRNAMDKNHSDFDGKKWNTPSFSAYLPGRPWEVALFRLFKIDPLYFECVLKV